MTPPKAPSATGRVTTDELYRNLQAVLDRLDRFETAYVSGREYAANLTAAEAASKTRAEVLADDLADLKVDVAANRTDIATAREECRASIAAIHANGRVLIGKIVLGVIVPILATILGVVLSNGRL